MLTQDFIDQQKAKLLEQKKSIVETLKSQGGSRDDNVKDMEDFDTKPPNLSGSDEPFEADTEAQEVETFANRISVEKNLEEKLQETNSALERIEKGTYGKCKNCEGEEIPQARLEALPEATLCLHCEDKKKS